MFIQAINRQQNCVNMRLTVYTGIEFDVLQYYDFNDWGK